MTFYEGLNLAISAFAVGIAGFVWREQRKLQREANELQRATADLAKKQLELLRKEELAVLRLDLVSDSSTDFRFILGNVSEVKAVDVDLTFLLDDGAESPIVESEYATKFPAKVISPGGSITLIAALTLGTPTAYNARVSWTNPDGSHMEDEQFVSL